MIYLALAWRPADAGGFAAALPPLAYPTAGPINATTPLDQSSDSEKDLDMHEVGDKSHWHEPTGIDRAGIGKFGRPKTPYDLFMESEGIPVFRDVGLKTVLDMPMKPWKRLGGKGTYIQLYGT